MRQGFDLRTGDRWALACVLEMAARAALGKDHAVSGDMVLNRIWVSRRRGELQPREVFGVWLAVEVATSGAEDER